MFGSAADRSTLQERETQCRRRRKAEFLAGGSLVASGVWRRDRMRKALLLGGAALLYRAASRKLPTASVFEVSQTVNRQPGDVYAFWRDFNNWPLFMEALREPGAGATTQITPESVQIVEDRPNESFRWRSKLNEGWHQGIAEFRPAPGGRGTEVRLHMLCAHPRSLLNGITRTATGISLEQQVRESLRNFKQLLEAGEVPTTDGQPHGRRGLAGTGRRIAFRERADERRQPARAVTEVGNQQLAAS